MGAGQSRVLKGTSITYDLDIDESEICIKKFEVVESGEWIEFHIEPVKEPHEDYIILEWYLDEDLMENAPNWEEIGSTVIKVGTKLESLKPSDDEEIQSNSALLVDDSHPGYMFKQRESLQGSVLYRSVFKGDVKEVANMLVISKSDRKVVMVAHLEQTCKESAKMLKASTRRSILSYASIDSSMSEEEDMNIQGERTLRDHYKRLIMKAHANTVYGMYTLDSLIDGIIRSKELPKPPISYILADDGTAMAFRAYLPPSGKARANIILMSYDSIFLDPMASSLADGYPLAVYVCDLRGFGYSAGKRGTASSTTSPYADIRSFIRLLRHNSDLPIYLSGILFATGLILNYIHWLEAEPVDGIVLFSTVLGQWRAISPDFYKLNRIGEALKSEFLKAAGQPPKQPLDPKSEHELKVKRQSLQLKAKKGFKGLKMTSEAFEVNPMVVEEISASSLEACIVKDATKSLGRFNKPFAIFWGGDDEFLNPEPLSKLVPPVDGKTQRWEILEGATHLSIMNRPDFHQKIWEFISDQLPSEDTADVKAPSADVDVVPQGSFRFFNKNDPPTQTMLFEFSPGQRIEVAVACKSPKPEAIVIVLLPSQAIQRECIDMVNKQPLRVFKMFPCGFSNTPSSLGTYSEKTDVTQIYKEIELLAKLVKYNNPGLPIFLAGHGYGASMALNFADWMDQNFINGYILMAPIPDPLPRKNSKLIHPKFKKKLTKRPALSEWFARLFSSSAANERYNMMSLREETGLRSGKWEDALIGSVLVKDLGSSFEVISAPFLLLLPELDDKLNSQAILQKMLPFSKPPFQRVEVVPGANRDNLCNLSSSIIGNWIMSTAATGDNLAGLPAFIEVKHFEPIKKIGQGSYGHVWLARHKDSNRHFAVKIQDKIHTCKPQTVRQAVRELQVMSKLQTPFVPKFMAAFQDQLRLYIVMEYVVGGELLRRLQEKSRLSNDEARFYAAEILVVLDYLHSNRIAFRDLKPENILLDTLGHVRLVDFGYARKVSEDGLCGSFCGSPYYLAPELLAKGFYDGRVADIWSLGVLIYEMLVGKPPFLGKSMRSVYSRILLEDATLPSSLEDDAKDLLRLMLHKDPKLRLSSLEQVKHHRWFKNIDWELVAARQIVPPYQPTYSGDNDTSNYANFDAGLEEFFLAPRHREKEAMIPRDEVYEGYSA